MSFAHDRLMCYISAESSSSSGRCSHSGRLRMTLCCHLRLLYAVFLQLFCMQVVSASVLRALMGARKRKQQAIAMAAGPVVESN